MSNFIVLSVLQSAGSDYQFGIFKLVFLLWGNPCIKSSSFKITNQSVVKDAQLVPIIILNFWCKHGHQSKEMYRRSKSHGFWKWPFYYFLRLESEWFITIITNSNLTSFFRFVDKRTIYRLGIISLAHAPMHVTDFPVINVHVDELSSARIWQHKLCATFSASVNINYRLPIKVYYRICTLRHIKIEINHGSQIVFWVLTWVGRY